MIKVLYITNYGTLYGANRCLLELMEYLYINNKVEPTVLITGIPGPFGEECNKLGIRYINIDFRNRTIEADTRFKFFRKQTRFVMRMYDSIKVYKYLKKQNVDYDIVHSNSSIFDIGYFLAKWNKVPHVWHIREFLKEDYQQEIVYGNRRIKKYYNYSDSVITISESIKKHVEKYGISNEVLKISDGIKVINSYEKKRVLGGCVNICIVGSIRESKNQLDVIKAIYTLVNDGTKNIHLYIVGNTAGKYYESLYDFIEKNNLKEFVTFAGYTENVNCVLRNMDIGITASDREAFGRVTIEYMANYMAVIGSDSGANVELISDEFRYPLHDCCSLAKILKKLVYNQSYLAETGNNNRLLAEDYTVQKNAVNIYGIYKGLF